MKASKPVLMVAIHGDGTAKVSQVDESAPDGSMEHEMSESPEQEKKEHDSRDFGKAPDNKEDMEKGGKDSMIDGGDSDVEDIIMEGGHHDDGMGDSPLKSMSLGHRAKMDMMKNKKGK